MPVRITANVLAPWAVQDSTGVVLLIQFHPTDARRLRASGADTPAEMKLLHIPTLYVQLDDVEHRFLQPLPCTEHATHGADAPCPHWCTQAGIADAYRKHRSQVSEAVSKLVFVVDM